MENGIIKVQNSVEALPGIKRQMILGPCYSHVRLIIVSDGKIDMASLTEEELLVTYQNELPAIGQITDTNQLSIDPNFSVDRGYYDSVGHFLVELKQLLIANGINEVKLFNYKDLSWKPISLIPKKVTIKPLF